MSLVPPLPEKQNIVYFFVDSTNIIPIHVLKPGSKCYKDFVLELENMFPPEDLKNGSLNHDSKQVCVVPKVFGKNPPEKNLLSFVKDEKNVISLSIDSVHDSFLHLLPKCSVHPRYNCPFKGHVCLTWNTKETPAIMETYFSKIKTQ